ncbi:hypothetical protein [Staphylococcus phage LY01]|nr:hypothetical protein [Staphylococcus phage LY01]
MTKEFYAIVQFQSNRQFQGREYIYKVPKRLIRDENDLELERFAIVSNFNHKDSNSILDLSEDIANAIKPVRINKIMNEDDFIESDYVNDADDLNYRKINQDEKVEYKYLLSFIKDDINDYIEDIEREKEKEKIEKLMRLRLQKLEKKKSFDNIVRQYDDKELNELFNRFKEL